MRSTLTTAVAVLMGAWLAFSGPGVLAEGEGEEAPPPEKTVLRMVRTKRILTTLETVYEKERSAETPDTAMLDRLEKAMADAKALLKPIQPEELTETEREALKKALGADGKEEVAEEPENALPDWQQRALDRAFAGTELSEDEEATAAPIITDWFTKSWQARNDGDSKAVSDLKRRRDKALEKALGRKKSRKLINKINGAFGGRR